MELRGGRRALGSPTFAGVHVGRLSVVKGLENIQEREHFVFAGDSPNDAPMFAFFPNAVGVANVRDFADRIATLPAYVTKGEAGVGFAELADFLLASDSRTWNPMS